MRPRLNLRVLLALVLLSLLLGAANNALSAHRVAWVGSPGVLPDPWDLVREPHLTGAWKGVKYFWAELRRQALPVAIGAAAVIALSLLWRRLAAARWGQIAETWFRLGTAAIFVAACWYKLANPSEFALAVAQYRFLPAPLVDGFSVALPAAELLVAAGLVFTPWTREMYLLMSAMWAMFIIALSQALARRLGITCGCFAIEGVEASVGEVWFSLERDLALIGPTVWLALRGESRWIWKVSATKPG